jgi:hypothetical protein
MANTIDSLPKAFFKSAADSLIHEFCDTIYKDQNSIQKKPRKEIIEIVEKYLKTHLDEKDTKDQKIKIRDRILEEIRKPSQSIFGDENVNISLLNYFIKKGDDTLNEILTESIEIAKQIADKEEPESTENKTDENDVKIKKIVEKIMKAITNGVSIKRDIQIDSDEVETDEFDINGVTKQQIDDELDQIFGKIKDKAKIEEYITKILDKYPEIFESNKFKKYVYDKYGVNIANNDVAVATAPTSEEIAKGGIYKANEFIGETLLPYNTKDMVNVDGYNANKNITATAVPYKTTGGGVSDQLQKAMSDPKNISKVLSMVTSAMSNNPAQSQNGPNTELLDLLSKFNIDGAERITNKIYDMFTDSEKDSATVKQELYDKILEVMTSHLSSKDGKQMMLNYIDSIMQEQVKFISGKKEVSKHVFISILKNESDLKEEFKKSLDQSLKTVQLFNNDITNISPEQIKQISDKILDNLDKYIDNKIIEINKKKEDELLSMESLFSGGKRRNTKRRNTKRRNTKKKNTKRKNTKKRRNTKKML